MTVRHWTDADTATLCAWLDADPSLWVQMGFDHRPTVDDVDALVTEYRTGEPHTAVLRAVDHDGDLAALVSIKPRLGTVGAVHIAVGPAHRGQGHAIGALGIETARDLGLRTLVAADVTGRTERATTRWLGSLGFVPRRSWQLEL